MSDLTKTDLDMLQQECQLAMTKSETVLVSPRMILTLIASIEEYADEGDVRMSEIYGRMEELEEEVTDLQHEMAGLHVLIKDLEDEIRKIEGAMP